MPAADDLDIRVAKLLRAQQIEDAHAACVDVLRNDADCAPAWCALSRVFLHANRPAEALRASEEACRRAPEDPGFRIQQGLCLAAAGRIEAARKVAETAAARVTAQNVEPELLSNLGSLFSACEAHQQALPCFQRAAEASPHRGDFLFNLATTQRALGDLEGAERACDSAIALDPNDCQAHYLRSDLRTQTEERNHVPALQALTRQEQLPVTQRVLAWFALGKELEDLGRDAAAFEALQAGAALHRASIRYDVDEDIEVIERIIAHHRSDALEACSEGRAGPAPLFVVGLPRSGTTLVERMLDAHSAIRSVGERNDFTTAMSTLAASSWQGRRLSRADQVEQLLKLDMNALGQLYCEGIGMPDGAPAQVLNKLPINFLYCGLIHAALPDARIVALRREARDSCFAAFKAFLTGPYGFTYDLEELGRYYLAFDRLMRHWRDTLPADRFVEVHYEALVHDPEAEMRRVLAVLDLDWEPNVLEFQRSRSSSSTASASQIRRGIYTSSVKKWERHAARLQPLLDILEAGLED